MEPTQAQLAKLAEIRKHFGNAMEGSYTMLRSNGHMRVRLKAQAGVWRWTFDRNGQLSHNSLTQELFDKGQYDDPARSGTLFDPTD